jgi:hypothetical protein
MSGGFYEGLEDFWEKTKIEELGAFQPQQIMEDMTKRAGRGVQSLGSRTNLPWLENFGRDSVENPVSTIAKASTAVGGAYAGGALGGLFGAGEAAPVAAEAVSTVAPLAAEVGSVTAQQAATMTAEELAKQIAMQARGLMGSAKSGVQGLLSPVKSGLQSAQQGFGNLLGTGYVDQIGNVAEGAMAGMPTKSGLLGMGGGGSDLAQRYVMRQGMDMMQPQQPMQAPPQPLRYQQEPMQNPYGQQDPFANLTEEEKMKLRMMGYQV